jgi:multiple sugar transport system permease protein
VAILTAPAPPRDPVEEERLRRRAKRRRRFNANLTGWAFVGPSTVLVLALSVFPALWAFFISRTRWDLIKPAKDVGWHNYELLAHDPDFINSIKHTVELTALFVPASILLGILLAIALNQRIRFAGFYRTAIFIPFVASAAATGILASFVFEPNYGIAGDLLRRAHLPQMQFLESPSQALVVLVIIILWGQLGFTVVVYLAALQDIPQDIVEAATVDGANRRQVFRHVTLPELAPVTVFTAVWNTITALQTFDIVYTTTRGGPLQSTETLVFYVWDVAFHSSRFGYGAAGSYVLFAATMLITLGMIWYSRRTKIEAF